MGSEINERKRGAAIAVLGRILDGWSPRFVLLVGSVARGYAEEGSDVDILVIGSKVEHARSGKVEAVTHGLDTCKLEFYSDDEFTSTRTALGADAVRQLNRLREAQVLFETPGEPYDNYRPSLAEVRAAFGSLEAFASSIEENLAAAYEAYTEGVHDEVTIRSYMAAEALAYMLLSVGDVPVTYTKPKWVMLGLRRLGSADCQDYYLKATNSVPWAHDGEHACRLLERAVLIVKRHCTEDMRSTSRPLRRLLWIAEKHARDARALVAAGDALATRSGAIGGASFCLQAIAASHSWRYECLADAHIVVSRLSKREQNTFEAILFPAGKPTSVGAAETYNAAVTLHSNVLRHLGVREGNQMVNS